MLDTDAKEADAGKASPQPGCNRRKYVTYYIRHCFTGIKIGITVPLEK